MPTETLTYAEEKAREVWEKAVKYVHEGDGASGFKILEEAIQKAVNQGEALAYAKRNARF